MTGRPLPVNNTFVRSRPGFSQGEGWEGGGGARPLWVHHRLIRGAFVSHRPVRPACVIHAASPSVVSRLLRNENEKFFPRPASSSLFLHKRAAARRLTADLSH